MTESMNQSLRAKVNKALSEWIQKQGRHPLCTKLITVFFNFLLKNYIFLPQATHQDISRKLKTYIQKKEYGEEMKLLKKSIDETSIKLIDKYVERQLKGRFMYSLAEIRRWRDTRTISLPYIFPLDNTAIADIFVFHNGLKFIPKHVASQLHSGCVIDGGAASGDSSLMFLEYKPLKIYAVEPSPVQIKEIQEVLKMNAIGDAIEIIPYGLSDKREIISICDQRNEKFDIQTITIDEFTEEKRISCIKLDVEGIELAVILGAKKTIIRDRPVLLISLYHTPEDLFKIKPLIECWGLGYKFMIRDTELCNSLAGVHLMLIAYCEKEVF